MQPRKTLDNRRLDPSYSSHFLLAKILAARSIAQSGEHFLLSIKHHQENPEAHYHPFLLNVAILRPVTNFKSSIKHDPEHSQAHYNIALAHVELNNDGLGTISTFRRL